MFSSNLNRCCSSGGSVAILDMALSCRALDELAAFGGRGGSGCKACCGAPTRSRPSRSEPAAIAWRIHGRSRNASRTLNSNAEGFTSLSSRFAVTEKIRSGRRGISKIVSGGNGARVCIESVNSGRHFRVLSSENAGSFRQVNFLHSERSQTREEELISNGRAQHGAAIALGLHQSKRCHVRVYGAASHGEATVASSVPHLVVRKGALLEFERESGKTVLAVAQNREGKKNWIAVDQGGKVHTVRPQQITYLIPSHTDFQPSEISSFMNQAQDLEDVSLLEYAWEEVIAEDTIQIERLAEILYSQHSPLECYTVHRMLSSDQLYFKCKLEGLTPIYEPRPLSQLIELQQKKLADIRAQEQFRSYVSEIKLALERPLNDKPPKRMWHNTEFFHLRTESLTAYSLGYRSDPVQKKNAEEVLEAMSLTKNPPVTLNLLIEMGALPRHVNLDMLKMKNLVPFNAEHLAAVEELYAEPPLDPDQANRVDLTALKVYTIDSDDADEIDDGLSATRLPDGRIKVWIHVADPTRWLPHEHLLCREAEARGTSIYMPTGVISMFPMELAESHMSLQQGLVCCAVTVSVTLREDGSIAEYEVMNSTICPTYKMSYENVEELLLMVVEEEPELYLLAEAARSRTAWRLGQGAMVTFLPEPHIKILDPDSAEPAIHLEVLDQTGPSWQLVAEMMILCGEAISMIGAANGLCLPYRGQSQPDVSKRALANVPEGPSRAFAMRRFLGSAGLSYTRPKAHASLGLPGYVQFTSPIRRYSDLLAHYQVKAFLRGEKSPFTSGSLEAKMALANFRGKNAKRLQSVSERYWTIEYLRRQPKERKYKAVLLRLLSDTQAVVLLLEVGFRGNVWMSSTPSVGTELLVHVVDADPRKDVISLKEG